MDNEKLIELFKLLAPDLADLQSEKIEAWLKMAMPHVSKCRFGALYEQALVYYAAYLAELGRGIESSGGGTDASVSIGAVTSIKEGDLAITYGGRSDSTGNATLDALNKNIYGQMFAAIAQKVGGGSAMTRLTRMC